MQTRLIAVVSIAAVVAACGSGAKDRPFDDASPTEPSPGAIGSSGSLGDGRPDGGSPDDSQCGALVTSAQRAEVDIVVVIDTSGSMDEETAQVKANINTFAQTIGNSGLDYTVVMIAETPPSFPFPGFPLPGICVPVPLGNATCGAHNPPKLHHLNESVGSTESLSLILSTFGSYEPWLRPAAFKVFIEVTDDNSLLGYQQFDQQLLAKSPAQFGTATNRRYVFNSICGWKKGTAVLDPAKCGTSVNTGDQYQQLSKLTGGVVDSVCESDYSGVFDNIAKGLVKKLGCEFAFPTNTTGQPADPTRVAVSYTPGPGSGGAKKTLTQVTDASKCASIADGWYYDDNATPTRILFCPSTCTAAGADTEGKLEIAVGCKAPPPK